MAETLVTVITALNSMSPLAIIALLSFIIYHLTRGHKAMTEKVDNLSANDLHELPEMAETLRRIEVGQAQGFATVVAKLEHAVPPKP